MTENVKTTPEIYHSITPYLVVRNASKAIDFYKKAFDENITKNSAIDRE